MHSVPFEATWDEHVQGFVTDCLMTETEASEYADALASMGMILPTDRADQYRDAGIPEGVSM